jgi:hypothetical protein
VRQLLSESLVLAAIGGAAGVLLAAWAGRILSGLRTDWLPVPLHFDFHLDGTVLAFAAGASLLTTMLFGLAPALMASKLDLVPSLKSDATGEGSVRRRIRLRDALVVTQLALSLVLLVAGALLARGLLAARATDLGYDPAPVSYIDFNLQMNGYDVDRDGHAQARPGRPAGAARRDGGGAGDAAAPRPRHQHGRDPHPRPSRAAG